jgi:hypothetical protein
MSKWQIVIGQNSLPLEDMRNIRFVGSMEIGVNRRQGEHRAWIPGKDRTPNGVEGVLGFRLVDGHWMQNDRTFRVQVLSVVTV